MTVLLIAQVNPVAAALLPLCLLRLQAGGRRPWTLGLQGPQGCGKSTAAADVVAALHDRGLRAVTVSIDDFYLTHAEQRALAARHPGNPYLLYRGYPGTHDVALGARVLDALSTAAAGQVVHVPVYDKSAREGRGDRARASSWRPIAGPLDVVLLEGWMLGFRPVDDATLEPAMAPPNHYLRAYEAWSDRLDALVHIAVASLDTIVEWRVDAERARRARGEAALSDDEARDYIERFLPAYRVYVPALEVHPPCKDFRSLQVLPDRSVRGPFRVPS